MNDQPFIDFYNVLQVDPNCDARILETAYRYLAKMYHPDHATDPDTAKLTRVIEAYRVLRDPERRAEYDRTYFANGNGGSSAWAAGLDIDFDEETALDDAEAHARILMYLYRKRRENAQDPGVVGFYLQEMLGCSYENLDFHKWYLKEKGFVEVTEQGTMAITIQGIDHVISLSRTTRAEKLLLRQSDAEPD